MTVVKFEVSRSPFQHINRLMRAADLGIDGVGEPVYETFSITWKDGEIVDNARKQQTKDNIKESLEKMGYDLYSVEVIK